MKTLRFIPYEVYYNGCHYDHKPIGETGKVVWGLEDNLGFYKREELK